MKTFSAYWTPALGDYITQHNTTPFTATLTTRDGLLVEALVNLGIDSHLEACYVPSLGDSYAWKGGRLHCRVSPQSLPVLIRRLLESEHELAHQLASDICSCLKIELI